MEMSYEAHQAAKGSQLKQQELFTEMFLEELGKMKGAEIAPHLSCNFDVLKREYNITLRFPVCFCKTDTAISDAK